MKRFLTIVGYGLGGILVALALSLGAFALASRRLGGPTSPVEPAVNMTESPTPSWEPSFEPTATNSPKPHPEPDPTHSQSAPAPTPAPTASAPSSPSGGSSSDGDPSGEGDGGDDHPGDD
jgi:outer membrane biosynthesis protein TonB